MSKITSTMPVGEAQVRAILENPGLSNGQILTAVQHTHPNSGTVNTVAWYRTHLKNVLQGKSHRLSEALVSVCHEYSGEVIRTNVRQQPRTTITAGGGATWPAWKLPDDAELLKLAAITIPYIRFLRPEIVRAIVEDNERHRAEWGPGLMKRGIDPSLYIWERSPCAFPGVRRYAGKSEIAQYHNRMEATTIPDALSLDDNSYPKAIWSFIFRGKPFQNKGPLGYALAHLADHKTYKNRGGLELEASNGNLSSKGVFGLYTSVSNTVYIPSGLIRPTDFGFAMRNLLQRKAVHLYGDFCNLLPPQLAFRRNDEPAWSLDAFQWAPPVGTTENIAAFLRHRSDRMEKLFGGL